MSYETGESPVGGVDEAKVPLGSMGYTIVARVVKLMQSSDWFRAIPKANYYTEKSRTVNHPYVLVAVDDIAFAPLIGGSRETFTVAIYVVRANAQSTETQKAYTDIERIRQMLLAHPRLDELAGCTLAEVRKAKFSQGEAANYFETIADVKLEVVLRKVG